MENIVELESNDIVKDNIEKLKEIFPDIVKDGKIDFDTLKLVLGEEIETDKENYKFEWVGKRDCYKTIQTPSNGTLKYIEKDSLNPDIGENIIIEGDNLEVLKLLQSSYKNSIKMIYIDPPYNTGNEFIYPDNYETPLDNYLELTGQKVNGETTQSKKSKDGRKHTQWLNMIFPRLLLSRTLLKEGGVIFISIGIEELSNLKSICDEIFGEENFIEVFSWVKTSTPPTLSTKSRKTNEYILCYEKNRTNIKYFGEVLDGGDQPLLNSGNPCRELKFPKEKVYFKEEKFPNGILKKSKPDRVELKNDIEIINGYSTTDFILEGEFKWTQKFLDEEISKGTTFIIKSEILSIRFMRDEEGSKRPTNFIKEKYTSPLINKKVNGVGTNETGTSELIEILGINVFDNPKPVSLIKYLSRFITEKDDIILDFFGGSGTTGQSILELNNEDRGNRKFILVQLPEPTKYERYPTISEITKDRIRRVIKGYGNNPQPINDGFKVFKLDKSNYKVNEKINVNKDSDKEDIIKKLRLQFRSSIVHDQSLVEGYNETDIIYENIIKEGYNLNSKIELVENIKEYKVYKITDIKNKKFYITFDKLNTDITQNKEFMGISNDTLFICFDHNLSDSDKSNLSKTFLLKTI